MGRESTRLAVLAFLALGVPAGLSAQFPVPEVSFSPDHSKLLMQEPTAAGEPTFGALVVQPLGRGETRRIVVPWKARIVNVMWSPNSELVAYMVIEGPLLSLWVAEPWSGESRMLAGPSLGGADGNPCRWLPNASGLLCRKPAGEGSSQLTLFPLSGQERSIGVPGPWQGHEVSPDGRWLLVRQFAAGSASSEVWDLSGTPSRSGLGAAAWRDDLAATLFWPEAGAAGVGTRVMQLEAPFTATPVLLVQLEQALGSVLWSRRDLAVIIERSAAGDRARTWLVDPSVAGGAPRLLAERAVAFLTTTGPHGRALLTTSKDGKFAFIQGDGAYLDRLELPSRRVFRLWRPESPAREEVLAVIDPDAYRIITRRQPNYFVRDLRGTGRGKVVQLTKF